MSRRPLVFVLGLTVGDFLLWNWSLNGNHDVIALASGLTLPPLAVASLWLLAVTAARLLGGVTRRRVAGETGRGHSRGQRSSRAPGEHAVQTAAAARSAPTEPGTRKIAA